MPTFGYTLMSEQSGPRELVADAVRAEAAGFDFEIISDHYSPWLEAQGHSPNAWAVLGAVAQATSTVELMTFVTCPTMRYHPAIVAQQAATIGLLSGDRFTLGLGAGENLNEHVVGAGWPSAHIRHEMLIEALHIISQLFRGNYVTFQGTHFQVDAAKLWDVSRRYPAIGVAVSGEQSCDLAGRFADAMIAVDPDPALGEMFDAAGGIGARRIGQVPVCWDPSLDAAVARAHEQFRWFGGGWGVNAELPGPAAFAGATRFVRPEDVAAGIACGPDLAAHVAAVKPFVDAGFTDIALAQIGGEHQAAFLDFAQSQLLPALRAEYR